MLFTIFYSIPSSSHYRFFIKKETKSYPVLLGNVVNERLDHTAKGSLPCTEFAAEVAPCSLMWALLLQ